MSEVPTLVSWNQPKDLGKIPDSDWVHPVGDTKLLDARVRNDLVVTDDHLLEHSRGRRQHLAAEEFPEGYRALRIVDSETGKVLTGSEDHLLYGVLRNDSHSGAPGVPGRFNVLMESAIPLPGDREITAVENHFEGTQTTIKPTRVNESEPDFIDRLQTTVKITPAARGLYVAARGRAGAIDDADIRLDIRQADTKVSGEVTIALGSDDDDKVELLQIAMGGDGQVERLVVGNGNLMRMLGINIADIDFSDRNYAIIIDPEQQTHVLDATAEALGLGTWRGLDLRLTASGLYAAMGQRNLDPTSVLIPRA